MKKIYVVLILFCGLVNLVYSQENSRAKAQLRAKIAQVKSHENPTNGSCWESGTEEYSAMVHLFSTDTYLEEYRSACVTCNNNGNCTYGQGAPIDLFIPETTLPYNTFFETDGNIIVSGGSIGTSINAWENDEGPRCEPNGDDDCKTNRYNSNGINFKSLVFPSNEVYTTSATFGSTNNHTWSIEYTWKYTDDNGYVYPLYFICDAQTLIVNANNIDAWVVELEAGETYEFETTAGPDTYLRLYGSDGYSIIAADDDGGTGTLSKLVYSPPATGKFFIEVSQYSRNLLSQNATLSYRVREPLPTTLTASETLVCRGTPVTLTMTSNTPNISAELIRYCYGNCEFFTTLDSSDTYVWNSASNPNENQFDFIGITNGNFYQNPYNSTACSSTSPAVRVYVVDAYPTIGYGGTPVICPGDNFQMFADFDDYSQGCTYQWQISSAGANGPWTNIPGAVNSQFNTGTLAATRWYRVKPVCPGNGCANSVSPVQQVSVRTASEIVCPSSQVNYTSSSECGKYIDYNVPIGPYIPDYCSSIPITQIGGLPSGSFFPIGTTTNTFLATSSSGNTATCSFNVVVNDAQPLLIQCGSGTIQTSLYAEPGTCVVTEQKLKDYNWGWANDNCPFTLTVAPAGPYGVGAHFLTWTATSSEGTKTCTGTITIEDNIAPVALCKNATVQLDASGNGSITGADVNNGSSDACGIGSLVLSKTNFTCANTGNNPVTLTVYDVNNKFATCNATVTVVDNEPPTATCQDVTVSLDGTGNVVLSAISVDNNSSDACGGIASMSLNPTSFNCSNIGANSVTLTVTDNGSNAATCSATVTVQDNTPPVATCRDITVTLDANGNGSTTATAVDNSSTEACGIASRTLDNTVFTCANVGSGNTVILTVTDNNTNGSTCSATVTVVDNTPPTATCQDVTVSLDASGNGSATAAAVNNSSSDACGLQSMVLSQTDFDCSMVGPVSIATLTVTDVNGNTAECEAGVVVVDNIPPVAICQDITVHLDGTGSVYISNNSVDNGSNDACGLQQSPPAAIAFFCADVGANTVSLTVTDNNSNTATCSATVMVVDDTPPVALCQDVTISLDATGNGSTTAAAVDNGSNDACGISSRSLDNTDYTCANVGSGNTVTLTVTDNNANISTCTATVTVTDTEAPAITCPSDLTVEPNIFNPCSAVVNGIDAVFSDNCSSATVGYAFSGATTGSGSSQASGQTFLLGASTVSYTVTDGAGLSSDCAFTVTVTDCNTVFSGAILWETDGASGVGNATVNLTGSLTSNDVTDVNGEYLMSFPYQTGNFTLKPVKNINKLNGVTSADVTAIQLHVTNTNPLPAPFKRIAADVNKSNSITTFDASLLNQALLGNPAALNQITSWRFVPASYTFPNPDAPWGFPEQIDLTNAGGNLSDQDFYGIKLGDVVSTWANPANFGAGEPLVMRVRDQVLQAGREISAVFRADQLTDLASFQFALYFDPAQLRLVSIDPETPGGLPMTADNFGAYKVAEGEIRAVWAPEKAAPLDEATTLFRLRFDALQSGTLLSDVLRLNDEALPGKSYNSQLEESGVALKYAATTATSNPADGNGLRLLQNRPNPFTNETTIGFVLPTGGGCDAQLRIFDATGRELWRTDKYYPAGYNAETVRLGTLTASGVLYYELTTPYGTLTKRMVRVAR